MKLLIMNTSASHPVVPVHYCAEIFPKRQQHIGIDRKGGQPRTQVRRFYRVIRFLELNIC
jgi:hypothetical protein